MKYLVLNSGNVALRLDPGDDIHGSIEKVFAEQGWQSGYIWGLGSVESPVLAHYKITAKKYSEVPFSGIFELTSVTGTVAQVEDNHSVHLHVTITDEDMKAYGGHLVKGKCSATAELILTKSSKLLTKKLSEESGLKVWDF